MINKETFLKNLKEAKNNLNPNQNKISLPVVYRICKKMQHGIKFMPINVSSDDMIVDGHHRYIGSIIANFELESIKNYPKPTQTNDFQWENVEFIEEDWDSPAKVQMLNLLDAEYNEMSIEDIESIIKKK